MNPDAKSPAASSPPASGSAVGPKRGEVWFHKLHGAVTIIKAWNRQESVCEIHSQSVARTMRRPIVKNTDLKATP